MGAPDRTVVYVRAIVTSASGTSSTNTQLVYRNADY
jgi:hypothetical protein